MCRLRRILLFGAIIMPLYAGAAAPEDRFNYILGTQTIGIRYKFTERDGLIETAERIHKMGSTSIKFAMSNKYCGEHYMLKKRAAIKTLRDLATKEPSIKHVLGMPFSYYQIWIYNMQGINWSDGLNEQEEKRLYKEVYDLAVHLLKTYSGSGKTFYLGNWEGDWHLFLYGNKKISEMKRCEHAARWFQVRQKAIADARRDTKHDDVNVYFYIEVCTPFSRGLKGKPDLTNVVLPKVPVDFISYSSYDSMRDLRNLKKALDYIDEQFKRTELPGVTGKRIMLGEFGFVVSKKLPLKTCFERNVGVIDASIRWGCDFVLFWEMYCNEILDEKGKRIKGINACTKSYYYNRTPGVKFNGFWLIDNNNVKQPLYYFFEEYYRESRDWVKAFRKKNAKLPSDAEYRKYIVGLVPQLKEVAWARYKKATGK